MEINSNNLVDTSTLQNKKFDNIETKNMENKELREVANDFEAFFLNQIMDVSLRSTKIAGEAPGSDIIKGMYLQNIADNSTGSLGISDMLYDFLSKNNK